MKKIVLFPLMFLTVSLLSVGCVKKCKLTKDNVDTGAIITDASIYPNSGYLTDNMGGEFHIDGDHLFAQEFQISFDSGKSKQTPNYSAYNILANPTLTLCDAAFERQVVIDDINQTVTYTVKITECSTTCDNERYVENYVLVPAFPDSYTVVYNVQRTQQ